MSGSTCRPYKSSRLSGFHPHLPGPHNRVTKVGRQAGWILACCIKSSAPLGSWQLSVCLRATGLSFCRAWGAQSKGSRHLVLARWMSTESCQASWQIMLGLYSQASKLSSEQLAYRCHDMFLQSVLQHQQCAWLYDSGCCPPCPTHQGAVVLSNKASASHPMGIIAFRSRKSSCEAYGTSKGCCISPSG